LLDKKRVLLLSEGFGSGHTQAAHALAVGLMKRSPHVETKVIELGGFFHPTLAPMILNAYRRTIIHSPKLVGLMYRVQYKKSLNRFTQLALHRLFYMQTATMIEQLRPHAIVCTHPIPNAIIARLRRLGMKLPLYTVITDYDAHGTWVAEGVSSYFVSTDEVKSKLLDRGIHTDHIRVTGIPVHPNFRKVHDPAKLYTRFGLKPMPTVMVMGGGWGIHGHKSMLDRLVVWRDRIQLLLCMGNNSDHMEALAKNHIYDHPNIHLFGFTNEIDKLMDVSDLLITKPGGMTCTEALIKGIPMMFYSPLPGQEKENCQYFTSRGYGKEITSFADIDHAFEQLTTSSPRSKSGSTNRNHSSSYNDLYYPTDCSQVLMDLLPV
jgi:processive 1,2-diacylglycerol beta-glucosyltransferase